MVKNLPEVQKTWVQSLGWKHPLEKKMATHSSILWTEYSLGLQRVKQVDTAGQLTLTCEWLQERD